MVRPVKNEPKFALLWWNESKTTDIVPIGIIVKSKRSVGMTLKIRWQDSETKLVKRYDATIRALGATEEELNLINIDSNGNIVDNDSKNFREHLIKSNTIVEFKDEKPIFSNSCSNPTETFPSNTSPTLMTAPRSTTTIVTRTELAGPSIPSTSSSVSVFSLSDSEENSTQSDDISFEHSEESVDMSKRSTNNKPSTAINDTENKSIDELIGEPSEEAVNLLASALPGGVTLGEIFRQTLFVAALKRSYQLEHRSVRRDEILPEYSTAGPNKVPICENSNFFLPTTVKTAIELSAVKDNEYNWTKLVKRAMMEVYGDSITKYSAKGTRNNSRPAINGQFYEAVYQWANSLSTNGYVIPRSDYTSCINKLASNKRKSKQDTLTRKKVILNGEEMGQTASGPVINTLSSTNAPPTNILPSNSPPTIPPPTISPPINASPSISLPTNSSSTNSPPIHPWIHRPPFHHPSMHHPPYHCPPFQHSPGHCPPIYCSMFQHSPIHHPPMQHPPTDSSRTVSTPTNASSTASTVTNSPSTNSPPTN